MKYNISVLKESSKWGEQVSGMKFSRSDKSARVLKCMEVEIMFLLQQYDINHLNDFSFEATRGKVRAVIDFYHVRFFLSGRVYAQIPIFQFSTDMVLWYNEIM